MGRAGITETLFCLGRAGITETLFCYGEGWDYRDFILLTQKTELELAL